MVKTKSDVSTQEMKKQQVHLQRVYDLKSEHLHLWLQRLGELIALQTWLNEQKGRT